MAMSTLNRSSLPNFGSNVTRPAYDRDRLRPGIVHIGVGNFHRVHQGVAVETCLHHPGHEGWAISGVGLSVGLAARQKAEAYGRQDNLYTVTQLTSPTPSETQIVGAMVEYLHAPASPETVLARLASRDTHIVSLTITEGGYNIDEVSGEFRLDAPDIRDDIAGGQPKTVFGYLVAALARRRRERLPPFAVLSCDNLQHNGDVARRGVVSFAHAVDPALAKWIEANGAFPNSMVDRIAPQVSESERQRLATATGVDDLVAATCETYNSWVVEDRFCTGRPRLELAGVVFSNEVPAYVAVKGRLSNAAHSLMCYPALLMGLRFVDEGMRRPEIVNLLRVFWERDAARLVVPPAGFSIPSFTEKVIQRFANPAIKDHLLRIAGDGATKIVTFNGQTIAQLIAGGGDLTRTAFLVACFGRYLGGVDDQGARFEPNEPHICEADWRRLRGGDSAAVLDIEAFRGLRLRESAAFLAAFQKISKQLLLQGAAAVLAQVAG
jgi:mannitol 2-dehydrogenase/sorbose reductase